NTPKEEYIAALFDDVNKVVLEGKTVLLYPHQIKIIENPENHTAPISAKATVLDSYFKGSYWLIEADFDGQIVFFNHFSDLQEKKVIHIYFILKRI
ncbi:MAG: iron(III) transport system ATP-binding protein, partial [Psychroserpens sp.]